MQNIPDSLRGFQPDMDPNLREVLEALDDELPQPPSADSDNEDPEDLFAQLVQSGELPAHEITHVNGDRFQDDEYESYESDDTIKGGIQGSEYLKEMAQWKAAPTKQATVDSKVVDKDDVSSMVGGNSVVGGDTESMFSRTSNANTHRTSKQRRKRRQRLGGAYSEAGTDYSMTSSANFRNEGLTSLDDRFDKVPSLFPFVFNPPCIPFPCGLFLFSPLPRFHSALYPLPLRRFSGFVWEN
jgi:protein LTV1